MKTITRITPFLLLLTGGCKDVEDHDHDHDHDHGVTTTVILNFAPADGGDTLSFTWTDQDQIADGPIDDILLPDASDHDHHDSQEYDLDIEVWNELEDPAEDVTGEIAELDVEHQFFFTGSGVESPATGDNSSAVIAQDYADEDADGLPIGLSNTVDTLAWGTGELTVTLRHLAPENDEPVKVAGMAEDVANGGFSSIGGDNDVQATFNIEVE